MGSVLVWSSSLCYHVWAQALFWRMLPVRVLDTPEKRWWGCLQPHEFESHILHKFTLQREKTLDFWPGIADSVSASQAWLVHASFDLEGAVVLAAPICYPCVFNFLEQSRKMYKLQ